MNLFRLPGVVSFVLVVSSAGRTPAQTPAEWTYDGKSLDGWLKQLKSDDAKERKAARALLSKHGGKLPKLADAIVESLLDKQDFANEPDEAKHMALLGRAALPALTQGLWDDDVRRRVMCCMLLRGLGPGAKSALPSLRRLLDEKEPLVRRQAIQTLAEIEDRTSLAALKRLLDDASAGVREAVALALAKLGADSQEIVPRLVTALRKSDADGRAAAAAGLRAFGPEAATATTALAQALRDENREVRQEAAKALVMIGPAAQAAAPALVAFLKDEQFAKDHMWAVVALWRVAKDPEAIRVARQLVQNDPAVRLRAAQFLWMVNERDDALTGLKACLSQADGDERREALLFANRIASGAGMLAKDIAPLLKDKAPQTRGPAAFGLARMGKAGRPALAELRELQNDADKPIAALAHLALIAIDQDAEAERKLGELMRTGDAETQYYSARSVGTLLGPRAAGLAPALRAVLAGKNPFAQLEAAEALWFAVRDPEILPALRELMKSSDAEIRSVAAFRACYLLRGGATPALPDMVRLLFDENSGVRIQVAEALGSMGPAALEAAPALVAALQEDQDDAVLSAAAESLGLIQPNAFGTAPALRARLQHPDRYVQVCAALALWQITQDAAGAKIAERGLTDRRTRVRIVAAEALWRMRQDERALPTLLDVLDLASLDLHDRANNERFMVVRALGRIGKAARSTVPRLLQLRHDDDVYMRLTIAEALEHIDPEAAKQAAVWER